MPKERNGPQQKGNDYLSCIDLINNDTITTTEPETTAVKEIRIKLFLKSQQSKAQVEIMFTLLRY